MMQDSLKLLLAEKENRTVQTVSPAFTVLQAVHVMNERNIGAVMVVEDGHPVGVFTERDVLVRVVGEGLNPGLTPISQVMTRNLLAVKLSTTVAEAMGIITKTHVRHLPVVEDDHLVGMISIGDLTRWMIKNQQDQVDRLIRAVRAYKI